MTEEVSPEDTAPAEVVTSGFSQVEEIQEPLKPEANRPSHIQLKTIVYNYDIRKRHQFDLQKTLAIFKNRQLEAIVKDDVGNPILGVTIPDSVTIDGTCIWGYIALTLHPHHKVKLLCGLENDPTWDDGQPIPDLVKIEEERKAAERKKNPKG